MDTAGPVRREQGNGGPPGARYEWLVGGRGDLLGDREQPESSMDKEDLSEMFGRAAFEKMQPSGEKCCS